MALSHAEKQHKLETSELKLRYAADLDKFNSKLRQNTQLHAMELKDVHQSNRIATEQLKAQVRALTGSLDRESQKTRENEDLTDEVDRLKVEKEKQRQNYENAIKQMERDHGKDISAEIGKRVKGEAQLNREIADLKRKLEKEKGKTDSLRDEIKNLKEANEQLENRNNQYLNTVMKQRKILSKINRRSMRKGHTPEASPSASGGDGKRHSRKKSNRLRNRTVTVTEMGSGGTQIVIEKNKATDDLLDHDEITKLADDMGSDSDDLESGDEDNGYDTGLGGGGPPISRDDHDDEMRVKDNRIKLLDDKVKSLQSQLEALQKEKADELSERDQRLGALQTKLETETEHFLTQKQSFEYKMSKKESDSNKMKEELSDLKHDHGKQIRSLKQDIAELTQQVDDKEEEIRNLEQNVDMQQAQIEHLRHFVDDYENLELEMDDIDAHYEQQIEEIKQQNEEEIQTWKMKVRTSSMRLEELQKIIAEMNDGKLVNLDHLDQQDHLDAPGPGAAAGDHESSVDNMETLEREHGGGDRNSGGSGHPGDGASSGFTTPTFTDLRMQSAITEESSQLTQETPNGRQRRESREVDMSEDGDNDHHREAAQRSPAAVQRPRDSVAIGPAQHEIDEMVRRRVDREVSALREKMEMTYALKEDAMKGAEQKKYENMERVLMDKIDGVEKEKTEMAKKHSELQIESGKLRSTAHRLQTEMDGVKQRLEEKEGSIVEMKAEMEAAERSRINLLERFMSEMDRMRDEIKTLNALTRRSRRH